MATFVLAVIAKMGADQGAKTAEEAAKTAQAAVDEAVATLDLARSTRQLADEQRRDRDLAWRPVIVIEDTSPNSAVKDFTIYNVGAGVALNCLFVIFLADDDWLLKKGFALRPGQELPGTVHRAALRDVPLGLFDPSPASNSPHAYRKPTAS